MRAQRSHGVYSFARASRPADRSHAPCRVGGGPTERPRARSAPEIKELKDGGAFFASTSPPRGVDVVPSWHARRVRRASTMSTAAMVSSVSMASKEPEND